MHVDEEMNFPRLRRPGRRLGRRLGLGLAAVALPLCAQAAPRVSESVLYAFGSTDTGAEPWAPLVLGADGHLYGTAAMTGPVNAGGQEYLGGYGTVFSLDTAGAFTLLHSFDPSGPACEGAWPGAGGLLQATDGSFYGVTVGGGSQLLGTVYRLDAGGNLQTLHAFDGSDGANPWGGVIDGGDGYFYGATAGTYGTVPGAADGTLYRIASDGTLSVLYTFGGNGDSAHPLWLLRGRDGNFYGTTGGDAASGDYGSVFRITPAGVFTTLYAFPDGTDGVAAGLVQGSDGNFYGVRTPGGGIGVSGAISPCQSSGGGRGQGGTMAGAAATAGGKGSVFRITPAGRMTTLHEFGGADGADPQGQLVQGRDGYFYGTTVLGGSAGDGTIFRIGRDGRFTLLYSFQGGGDAANPAAALLEDPDASVFYGTSFRGGGDNIGTVYRVQLRP